MEDEVKQTLGDQGYQKFTEYRKSIPSRKDASELESRANEAGIPLTSEQKEAVFNALNDERKNFIQGLASTAQTQATTGSPNAVQSQPNLTNNNFEQGRVNADQRALDKVGGVLSTDQFNLLVDHLNNRNSKTWGAKGVPNR